MGLTKLAEEKALSHQPLPPSLLKQASQGGGGGGASKGAADPHGGSSVQANRFLDTIAELQTARKVLDLAAGL